MKKIIWILVVLVLAAGAYVAYKRIFSTDQLVGSIPKDAAVVFAMDMKSIAEKAGGEKLKDMNMIKRLRDELKKKGDPFAVAMNELFDDPLKSGLNFLNRAYVFVSFNQEKPVVGFVCGVLNSSALEAMIRKFPLLKDSIVEKDHIKSISFNSMTTLGWSDKELIFIGGMNTSQDYMKNMFNHSSPSITSVSNFEKFNDSKFDAGVFINYSSLLSLSTKMYGGASGMLGELYKDTYADMTTVFENNSVVTNMHYYIDNKEMEKKLMMFNEKGLSNDHLKLISDKHVLGMMSMSFDPKKLIDMFDVNPLASGLVVEMAQQAGISKDELKDLLTGDISVAFTDVRNEMSVQTKYDFDQKTGAMTTKEVMDTVMTPMFTATVGIKTHTTFEKLMKRTGLRKEGAYYVIKAPALQFYMVENKVGITVTNDKKLADEMAEKKELTEIGDPAKSIVRDNPFGFYMDLNLKNYPELLYHTMQEKMGTENYNALMNATSILKDVEMKSSRNGGVFELKLTEGSGNSLYRMLDALDKNVYPLIAAKEAKKEKMIQQNTTQAIQDSIVAAEIKAAITK